MRHAVLLLGLCFASVARAADCDTERGRRAFVKCMACHASQPGATELSGPNLWGVMGQRAGNVEGYIYSDAIAQSGVTWTRETLGEYLANPSAFLPGTRMAMAPIRDAAERDALGCYLATLTDAGDGG